MAATIRSGARLREFTDAVCLALGAPADVAAVVAGHLSRSNLSGHDSHGVLRLPGYREATLNGQLVPGARARIVSERGAVALIDAQRSFGHHSTAMAMDWAVSSAPGQGIAVAAIRHSTHIGRLGEYVETAAAAGLIGIATTGVIGAGGVAPFGAGGRFLGTNPWAYGVPAGDRPMIFDSATSALAEGKVRLARARGVQLPPGVIIDARGLPSTDPADLYAEGALLPLGGDIAGHKGFGYAIASALLGGLAMIDDPDPTVAGTAALPDEPGWFGGALVMAIDPGGFGDRNSYERQATEVLGRLRGRPPGPGRTEVLVPGDPERRARAARERSGVEIAAGTMTELDALAAELGIPPL